MRFAWLEHKFRNGSVVGAWGSVFDFRAVVIHFAVDEIIVRVRPPQGLIGTLDCQKSVHTK